MRTGKRIALLFCLAAVLGLLAWWVSRPRVPDPIYEGKRLSYWMRNFGGLFGGDYNKRKQAYTAVKSAGTNAIPLLLQMLRTKDSPLKVRWYAVLQKQKWIEFHPIWAGKLRHNAADAFIVLGSRATNAIPELLKIHEQNQESQVYIDMCLAQMGPTAEKAVPILIQDLGSRDSNVRFESAHALGRIHPRPEVMVPALTKLLEDPSPDVIRKAAWELAQYGSSAKSAVPSLLKASGSLHSEVGIAAKEALTVIDPGWSVKEEQGIK